MKAHVPNSAAAEKPTSAVKPRMPFSQEIEMWRRGQEKTISRGVSKLPLKFHGYYMYRCSKCGAVYNMHIQKGLCEVTPEIKQKIEELKKTKEKAEKIPGVTFDATIPLPEDCIIGVPVSFVCPFCAQDAKKESDLGFAQHILIGAPWEDTDTYELSNEKDGNFFIMSSILGQGVPITCLGVNKFMTQDEVDALARETMHKMDLPMPDRNDEVEHDVETE